MVLHESSQGRGDPATCVPGNQVNSICLEQNTERQLERLAAQRALYASAKQAFALHALGSTLGAAVLSMAALFHAEFKPYAALWGGVLTVLDIFWLTPKQKKLREKAATIQEMFDCDLLGLPWRSLKIGTPVDPEVIIEQAASYRRVEPSFDSLRDWYPLDICRMPLSLARIACQRTNAWWDAQQRRRYAFVAIAAVIMLLLVLLTLGIAREMSVSELLITAVAPLLSGMVLAMRQFKEHSEAADRLDKLKEHARGLWKRALAGAAEPEVMADSRDLQDELFEHRKRTVPVFDCVYWRLRTQQELSMQEAAGELLREFERSQRGLQS
jgi:hypothetical protein